MLYQESRWLADKIECLAFGDSPVAVNLGSQSKEFVERGQPWIDRVFLNALRSQGVKLTNIDLQDAPGVDLVGDLLDPEFQARIRAIKPTLVIACNVLEHVTDPKALAAALQEIVPAGGYLIVSCPRGYPHHPDPIDTGLRPSPAELAAFFPNLRCVHGEEVLCETSILELRSGRFGLAGKLARIALPFVGFRGWKDTVARIPWLFKPYRATCLILERPQV